VTLRGNANVTAWRIDAWLPSPAGQEVNYYSVEVMPLGAAGEELGAVRLLIELQVGPGQDLEFANLEITAPVTTGPVTQLQLSFELDQNGGNVDTAEPVLTLTLHTVAPPNPLGPLGVQSSGDVPPGIWLGGTPTVLEDFEDCLLDFGITASAGAPISSAGGGGCNGVGAFVDSVDADDGVIDGSGSQGRSWFHSSGAAGVTFTFPSPVTVAGAVWTDGGGTTTFEAFGPGMLPIATIGPVAIADGFITGETAEDHFFGVQYSGGIVAIKLSNTSGGIEVDHVQYGEQPVPKAPLQLPTLTLAGLIALTFFVAMAARRARHRASNPTQ